MKLGDDAVELQKVSIQGSDVAKWFVCLSTQRYDTADQRSLQPVHLGAPRRSTSAVSRKDAITLKHVEGEELEREQRGFLL